jgi:hypothetical protein
MTMADTDGDLHNELDFLIAWRQVEQAFIEAKAAHHADRDNAELAAAYQEAKRTMSAMRTEWRGIREYLSAVGAVNAAAQPTSIEATAN